MESMLLLVLLAASVATLALLLKLLSRPSAEAQLREELLRGLEQIGTRIDHAVREEAARAREEQAARQAEARAELASGFRTVREELQSSFKTLTDSTIAGMKAMGEGQSEQLSGLAGRLTSLTDSNERKLDAVRGTMEERLDAVRRTVEEKLDAVRVSVEEKLVALREDNAQQLDRMRATVDEKLQGTLEQRLGESFRQVSERLEQVHRGLGEMQSLASGVGDLKKVLANVKTRGTWGEVQLGAMLEDVLTPEQYDINVATRGGNERVEFAVKLPGRGDIEDVVWLPIDAKFPMDDYQRLVEAQERGDADAAEVAGKGLENRIRQCAKDISTKYVEPPKTTDFGILFLPTEGLFAEVLRRAGLAEQVQREYRVIVAGPTTIWSILSSLQMGFRTLAVEKRSGEVWKLLAAVKSEWTKYGEVLERVQKKLHEATDSIDKAQTRTRAIGRKLRDVQELPAAEARALLPFDPASDTEEDAGADEDEV